MALAIASVPVLTGEVAERFEAEAQKNYEKYLNRSETEKKEVAERYERGMEMVRQVLAKSHIGNRFKPVFSTDEQEKQYRHIKSEVVLSTRLMYFDLLSATKDNDL